MICDLVGCSAKFKNKNSLFVHKRRHECKVLKIEGKFIVFFGREFWAIVVDHLHSSMVYNLFGCVCLFFCLSDDNF